MPMAHTLRFTLALEPDTGSGQASLSPDGLDQLVGELIADLNSIESVRAEQVCAEAPEGSKGLGALVLGALQAEASLGNAIKVARFLKTRLLDGSPLPPIRLKVERSHADGSSTVVELEGAAADQEAIESLLSRLEATVNTLDRSS